eukprot:tig00001085_g6948.t1
MKRSEALAAYHEFASYAAARWLDGGETPEPDVSVALRAGSSSSARRGPASPADDRSASASSPTPASTPVGDRESRTRCPICGKDVHLKGLGPHRARFAAAAAISMSLTGSSLGAMGDADSVDDPFSSFVIIDSFVIEESATPPAAVEAVK